MPYGQHLGPLIQKNQILEILMMEIMDMIMETKTTQETNSKIRLVWNKYLKSSEYQRKESKD